MAIPITPSPPFKAQQQSFPGKTQAMDPKPDHGEDSYVGHGLLQGKRTLITGGDSGIGAAVAIAYAREGADVAIAYLPDEQDDAERIGKLVEDAGVRVLLHTCDISDRAQAETLIKTVAEAFGGLDVLVNNAAYQRYFHSFDEITLDEWEKTFATNVHAPFHLVRLALPHMPRGRFDHQYRLGELEEAHAQHPAVFGHQGRAGQPDHRPGGPAGREEDPRQRGAAGPDLDPVHPHRHGRGIGADLRRTDPVRPPRATGGIGFGLCAVGCGHLELHLGHAADDLRWGGDAVGRGFGIGESGMGTAPLWRCCRSGFSCNRPFH